MTKTFALNGTFLSVAPFRFGVDEWNGNMLLGFRDAALSAMVRLRSGFTDMDAALKVGHEVFPQGLGSQGAALQIFAGFFDGLVYALREDLRLSGKIEQKPEHFQVAMSAGRDLNREMEVLTAYDRLSRLLFSDALSGFQKAAEAEKNNSAIHLQLGFIYMFGCDTQYSAIDLQKAEQHIQESMRYAEAYSDRVDSGFRELVVRQLALCLYLQASQSRRQGRSEESVARLKQAASLLGAEERRLSPVGLHFAARIAVLLGEFSRAALLLASVCDSQWYLLRDSMADPEFAPIKAQLERIRAEQLASPGPQTARTVEMVEKTRRAIATADEYDDLKQMSKDRSSLREALARVEQAMSALDGTSESTMGQLSPILRDARVVASRAADLHVTRSRERRQKLEQELQQTERILAERSSIASRIAGGHWIRFLSIGLGVAVMVGVVRLFRMEFGGSVLQALWPACIPLVIGVLGALYLAWKQVREGGESLLRYRNRLQQLQPMIAAEQESYQRWLGIQNDLASQNWDPDTIEVVPSRSEEAGSAKTVGV